MALPALPQANGGAQFAAPLVNDGGTNKFAPQAGVNPRVENGETVCDGSVHLTTASGAGATIGTTSDGAANSTQPGSNNARLRNISAIAETQLANGLTPNIVYGKKQVTTTTDIVVTIPPNAKFATFQNVSDTGMWIREGSNAVVGEGDYLAPGGIGRMSLNDNDMFRGAIYAIHAGTGSKALNWKYGY